MESMPKNYRIGVDVGGTNTDAVILDVNAQDDDNRGVIAHYKTPTTPEVTDGIEKAIRFVLDQSRVPHEDFSCVIIGTTHFINAVVEQDARRLRRVAILRISKSFLREIPPFSEFPPGLASICNGYVGYIDGGVDISGLQEAPLNEEQVYKHCKEIRRLGLKSVVVAGVFSPIDEVFGQERRVREILLKELPGVDIVCSNEVAGIGFMERENASILNASILQYARRTIRGFKSAMMRLHLQTSLFITQNDGTIVDCSLAAKTPIRSFSSGATNSMRGAAYLAGLKAGGISSTVVVDIGGTTADAGVILPSGLPRQASSYVKVAGVTVNYSMPHLHSIGLGGGSIVREGGHAVGPDSVGYLLTTESRVFGGSTLTATDIAVAAEMAVIGTREKVKDLNKTVVETARHRIKVLLEGAVDMVKTAPEDLPVLLVGGGSVIVGDASIKGASRLIRPPFHDVANAVGAAVSKVGGTVDIVANTENQTVAEAVDYAKNLAIKRAKDAGARPQTISIAEVDAIPQQYVTNKVRTIVKAIGDLDLAAETTETDELGFDEEATPEESKDFSVKVFDEPPVNPTTYRPDVKRNKLTGIAEWDISEVDLQYLATGMYVLGCAGGGNPESTRIQLRDQLRAGHKMKVIDVSALDQAANIYWGGHMGSPAVSVERLASTETVQAVQCLMEFLREDSFDAVISLEIGGANGLEPFLLGSSKFFDRPIIDGDWMGRAFPTYWQTTLAAHEPGQLCPCAIDSGDGKSILMTRASNDEIVDRALRASCSEMGSRVGMAAKPTTTDRVRNFAVLNTVSEAWRIGRCIAIAQATNTLSRVAESIISEVGGDKAAKVLFRGKIVAVERRLHKGHSYGEITIAGLSADEIETFGSTSEAVAEGGFLKIPFKNENIYAEHATTDGSKEIIATVPDLISVLDAGSGRALGVPEYRYGLKCVVIGIKCSPRWTETKLGLEISAPCAFGFDIPYKPLGEYVEPKSVIAEFVTED